MNIKINRKNVHTLGVVLDGFSKEIAENIDAMDNNLTQLHSYFLDNSYDEYSKEYLVELRKISMLCADLQKISKYIIEYSNKFSDI